MKRTRKQNRKVKFTNAQRLCEIMNLKQKMDKLYEEFETECEAIAEDCEAEGYPSYGSTYEMRVESTWIYYEEEIEYLAERLNKLGGVF